MDTIEILKIIKTKLFEPRKKIVFDAHGKKILTDLVTYDRKNIDAQSSLEGDGWNVADKDYVDYRISEALKKIHYPSAPPIHDIALPAAKLQSAQKTVLVSCGEVDGEYISFFNPGLVLKRGWNILDFTLFSDTPFEDDVTLYVKTVSDAPKDQKLALLSKIKSNGKQTLSSDSKFKLDNPKSLTFLLKTETPLKSKISLQLVIEI